MKAVIYGLVAGMIIGGYVSPGLAFVCAVPFCAIGAWLVYHYLREGVWR